MDLDQQQDSRYQYNPAIHPLYRDVVHAQNDAERMRQAQKQFDRDKQRTQESAERLLYWGREDEAQQLMDDFNRRYNLVSEPIQSQSTKDVEKTALLTTPVMQQDNTRIVGPIIGEMPHAIKKAPQEVQNKALQEEVKNKNPTMSGFFDGNRFVITQDDGNVIYRQTYPAVAGKPNENGKFDYSPERQKIPNQGPIPEGTYWINPQKIIQAPSKGSIKDILNILGNNPIRKYSNFPGGSISWGEGKVEINPKQVDVGGVKRGNFTIHGGLTHGSRGCIDITENDGNFFDLLEKHRGNQDSVPIFVEYPNPKSRK